VCISYPFRHKPWEVTWRTQWSGSDLWPGDTQIVETISAPRTQSGLCQKVAIHLHLAPCLRSGTMPPYPIRPHGLIIEQSYHHAFEKSEVFRAVLLKIEILWDATLCRQVHSYKQFAGLKFFLLQGQAVVEEGARLLGMLDPEDEGTTVLRNVCTVYIRYLSGANSVKIASILL
jgi:hypothetical protein